MRIIGQTNQFIENVDKRQVVDKSIFYSLFDKGRRDYIMNLDETKFVKNIILNKSSNHRSYLNNIQKEHFD